LAVLFAKFFTLANKTTDVIRARVTGGNPGQFPGAPRGPMDLKICISKNQIRGP